MQWVRATSRGREMGSNKQDLFKCKDKDKDRLLAHMGAVGESDFYIGLYSIIYLSWYIKM